MSLQLTESAFDLVETADRLRTLAPLITSRWESTVRAEVPPAAGHDRPILQNHLPELLQALAEVLEAGGVRAAVEKLRRVAELHGEQRSYLEGYDLTQVICEYRLLRETLADALLDEPYALSALKLINTSLDVAIEESVSHFRETADRQFEHLCRVTESTLTHLRLDEILDELLERTRIALGTDTAVILLAEGDALHVRAAKGLEEEVRAQVAVPIGKGFAGQVAASRAPVTVPDTGVFPIWSPYIRKIGLKSLLGVPLMVEHRTTGVLHVGTRQPRHFTPADVRFLQLIADRSALTIDRARLLDELEQADEQKSNFMATVAHELRTPLSAITNALYILENITVPDDRAGRQLNLVGRQTRQLARLAEDLMDITRINKGKIALKLEPVAVCRLAREAVETVRPLIEARGQDLEVELPAENLLVSADPARLEQIFTNLLGNAVKYTQAGGDIALRIRQEGTEAVITVSDSGIGIDPLVLPQVFDMFHQADYAQARSQGGLGIGLALVKRLVELQGGSVAASSQGPGSGAEFVVRLPLLPGQ